jgi:hypothetical protein
MSAFSLGGPDPEVSWPRALEPEWRVVGAERHRKPRAEPRSPEFDCFYGRRCTKGLSCGYRHDEAEEGFFRANGGVGKPSWKTRECPHGNNCFQSRNPLMCDYAHLDEPHSFCFNCQTHGHVSTQCPQPESERTKEWKKGRR